MISAGTNSCRLLIAASDGRDIWVETQASKGTRLGEGIARGGGLQPDAIERTLAQVAQYVPHAQRADGGVWAIGTSALRDAPNAGPFLERFEQLVGVPLDVLGGDAEARASFDGALLGLRAARALPEGALCVVDIGGGSVEFAVRTAQRNGAQVQTASIELGAVRLTERFLPSDPPTAQEIGKARAFVQSELSQLDARVRPQGAVVAVGGTANTAARMLGHMNAVDRKGAGVTQVRRDDLASLFEVVIALPLRWRKQLHGMPAQRADIFPAGVLVLNASVELAGNDAVIICQHDLLLGYVAERLGLV